MLPETGGLRLQTWDGVLDWVQQASPRYTGVELCVRTALETPNLSQKLRERGLACILLAITDGPMADIAGVCRPGRGRAVEEHLAALEAQVAAAGKFGAVLINVHGGRDYFSRAERTQYFRGVAELERKYPAVPIAHETHRGRILYSPWIMDEVLDEFPRLSLVADLSHFVCVAETLADPELARVVERIAPNVVHVHARVGFEEGPQCPDPRAPEWTKHLETHEDFWRVIWRAQRQRGVESPTLTPEHGPFPYQHVLPHTQCPTSDIHEINSFIAEREARNFLALEKK